MRIILRIEDKINETISKFKEIKGIFAADSAFKDNDIKCYYSFRCIMTKPHTF